MSYADAAAKGPKQSAEDARAPPVPSLSHSDFGSESTSLIDVDSPHVNSVPSDFEQQTIKTETQAARLERELEDRTRAEMKRLDEKSRDMKSKAEDKGKHVKAKAQKSGQKLRDNSDNPVYVANALIWGIGAVALSVAAYQKHSEGKLDAKLAGSVVGAVGAFAVADYFASSWLLENKYPSK